MFGLCVVCGGCSVCVCVVCVCVVWSVLRVCVVCLWCVCVCVCVCVVCVYDRHRKAESFIASQQRKSSRNFGKEFPNDTTQLKYPALQQ